MKKIFIYLVIIILLSSVISSFSVCPTTTYKESIETDSFQQNPTYKGTKSLVRIFSSSAETNLPRGVEMVSGMPNQWIDIIISSNRLHELNNADFEYLTLIEDIQAYEQSIAGQYHSLAQMEQILVNIANEYPEITSLYSIGTSYEGRDILCLEITDNPGVDEGEPGVFYMGLHHAREWPTVEICLFIAQQLTSQYATDPDIADLINNRRLWLVPCVNPDGYYYSHDLGNDWRKNRHYFPEYGAYGVDLNRNYGGSSNGVAKGEWGSLGEASVSHNADTETYCGPGQLSEHEVKAIRDIFLQHDICASISWHTYGELVMWPWAYSGNEQAPDAAYLSQIGQQMASLITKQSGYGTYTPTQSAGLYPTTGDTTDWAYGYSHYILGKPTFSFTIEACSSFHPSASYLDQIVEENYDAALYLLQESENIQNTVTPRVIPPTINEMNFDPDGNYLVEWAEQNPNANPDYFQLDELTDLSIIIDDSENGSSHWNCDGFSLSTQRSHSGVNSYKTRKTNNDVCSMTTKNPVAVTSDTKLSFWTWYSIENNWDYALVEISTTGRSYHVLDTFTGISSGWQYKEYDLSEYGGESVFIRFRYTTDSYTTLEGFYVDDIFPIATYDTITTLSDTITETSYQITGRENKTYYYRVRGYNSIHGWGDFSTLQSIVVGGDEDTEPPIVEILKPKTGFLYFKNNELFPFFSTIIIGNIEVEVQAMDNFGVERVEFYIDDKKIATDTTDPYTFSWTQKAFFKHTIKIVAIDTSSNRAETEMLVSKFF